MMMMMMEFPVGITHELRPSSVDYDILMWAVRPILASLHGLYLLT